MSTLTGIESTAKGEDMLTGVVLSKRVAELYGIRPFDFEMDVSIHLINKWLHEDSARCFELMVEEEICIDWVGRTVYIEDGYYETSVNYPVNELNTCTAILQCLVKMKEQS